MNPNAYSQFASVASLRSVSYLLRNNWSSLERNLNALTWVLENGSPARFGLIRQAIIYCGLCSAQSEVSGLQISHVPVPDMQAAWVPGQQPDQ
ncbi:MAG: hypothetical protein PHI97_35100, partial [Desulfobulbus sp.]|nr:hypothetical protein [Desulfobulbus sp.]